MKASTFSTHQHIKADCKNIVATTDQCFTSFRTCLTPNHLNPNFVGIVYKRYHHSCKLQTSPLWGWGFKKAKQRLDDFQVKDNITTASSLKCFQLFSLQRQTYIHTPTYLCFLHFSLRFTVAQLSGSQLLEVYIKDQNKEWCHQDLLEY